ncbi:MAG: HAD family hydrolase [Blautia wexlerae]
MWGYKSEELIAFGDSQNDKSMIQYAGIGVAMENATDELKKRRRRDHPCPTNRTESLKHYIGIFRI